MTGNDQPTTRNDVGSAAGPVMQAGIIHGDVHIHHGRGRLVIPRQLPVVPTSFFGRAAEMNALTACLAGEATHEAARVATITGPGGIGKTWLGLFWAHRNVDRFPDGQLYLDLHGFSSGSALLSAEAALRGALESLGIEQSGLPTEFNALVGLYRSLVADMRMLIMLDNAREAAQVIPLLPGRSECSVLVTSRSRLVGLSAQGAHRILVPVLYERTDEPVWEADMLNTVGWYLARLGQFADARSYCEAALEMARSHGSRQIEADSRDSLGYIAQNCGDSELALRHYQDVSLSAGSSATRSTKRTLLSVSVRRI